MEKAFNVQMYTVVATIAAVLGVNEYHSLF